MSPAANAEPGNRPPDAAPDRPAPPAAERPPVPGQRPAPPGPAPAAVEPDRSGTADLTDRQRDILAFERRWWKRPGAKEQAIRDTFELSATRYYQLLNHLLDDPAALAADPVLVGRLRRLRSAGTRSRRR
jgi:hypothetical protein